MESMPRNIEKQAEASRPVKVVDPLAEQAEPSRLDIISILMESSSDSDSSEVSSDDEPQFITFIYDMCESTKRNCITNYYTDEIVPTYTDIEFKQHFRISRELFKNMSKRIDEAEWYKNQRPDKRLSARTYLAVFLWFAGHEASSFRDLSDRFDLSIATISRIIEKVTMFISSLSPEVIKWPNEEKKMQSSQFFYNKTGFPKAIGCIDGTHIAFDPPKNRKDDYTDRKGNTSLCMQCVCDENKKFIDVFIGYPGSSHDSWVFKNSALCEKMASACGDYYLLGDSAYSRTQYLLTPYEDNGILSREQINFNSKLSSARVAIEHSFRILKQRFRKLYYCKLKGIEKVCHFIRSCCILHNLANENDFEWSISEDEDDDILYCD